MHAMMGFCLISSIENDSSVELCTADQAYDSLLSLVQLSTKLSEESLWLIQEPEVLQGSDSL